MNAQNFDPFPVLKTQRLIVRQLRASDDNEIFALRSSGSVNKYLDRQPCESIDDAREFIRTINANVQRNESIYWAITFRGIDKLIGTICLFDFSEDHSDVEIGYELLPDFQGKGIMLEAASKVVHFAFQQLGSRSVKAFTHSENQSSTRLLEKLGFKKEASGEKNFLVFKLTHNW